MKDNEPNINVPLLASKGKGWENEWEKIQQYVFVEGADEDENGISTFLKRRTAFLFNGQEYDEDSKKKDDERAAVCAELFISLHKKWHEGGVVDFVLPEGASFFNVCISRESLYGIFTNLQKNEIIGYTGHLSKKDREKREETIRFTSNTSEKSETWEDRLEKHPDQTHEGDWIFEMANLDFKDEAEMDQYKQDKVRAGHEKIVRELEKYCVAACCDVRFPNQNETQAGIQLFDHYTNYPNNVKSGIEALKKSVFEKAGEKNIRQAVLNALDDIEEEILENDEKPENQEANSKRGSRDKRWYLKREYIRWFCPVRDPYVVRELLGIPVKDVPNHLSKYRKKLLPQLIPALKKEEKKKKETSK
ncbi:MAG: hypothetical protein J6J31_05010 [Thermoguttaceae bacterium]|nr:hypothetical protein [Thermoguttaceae bacterium]